MPMPGSLKACSEHWDKAWPAIAGSFAESEPEKCRSLEVQCRSRASLISALGPVFELLVIRCGTDRTPTSAEGHRRAPNPEWHSCP
jgi:hypothetical protein